MKSKQILAISAASALIIIALSLAYYFVIFLPEKNEQETANKLYNQLTKQSDETKRLNDMKDCTNEVNKNIEKAGTSIKVKSNQEALDIYKQLIDLCMQKKGY